MEGIGGWVVVGERSEKYHSHPEGGWCQRKGRGTARGQEWGESETTLSQ